MVSLTKVTCSNCGLQSTPHADAMCPACGMPVTIDVRDELPAPEKNLPSVEALSRQLDEQRTRRKQSLLNREMGPKVIIGGLVLLALFRFAMRYLFYRH